MNRNGGNEGATIHFVGPHFLSRQNKTSQQDLDRDKWTKMDILQTYASTLGPEIFQQKNTELTVDLASSKMDRNEPIEAACPLRHP